MKVCVSIPVHEQPEVIYDQIRNFRFYFPECVIVLHQSRNFEWPAGKPQRLNVSQFENVYLNPESLPTWSHWGSFAHVHNANFRFAAKTFDFDYFAIHASNDMMVRRVDPRFIAAVDAGVRTGRVPENTTFGQGVRAWKDRDFAKMRKHLGTDEIYGAMGEGSFYKRELFAEIVDIIEKFYDYRQTDLAYERMEFYYPTLARRLCRSEFAHGYLFCSVTLGLDFVSRAVVDLVRSGDFSREKLRRTSFRHRCFRVSSFHELKKRSYEVAKRFTKFLLRSWQTKTLDLSGRIKDDVDLSQQYTDVEHLYAVKRVDRYLNDSVRVYIREQMSRDAGMWHRESELVRLRSSRAGCK